MFEEGEKHSIKLTKKFEAQYFLIYSFYSHEANLSQILIRITTILVLMLNQNFTTPFAIQVREKAHSSE